MVIYVLKINIFDLNSASYPLFLLSADRCRNVVETMKMEKTAI